LPKVFSAIASISDSYYHETFPDPEIRIASLGGFGLWGNVYFAFAERLRDFFEQFVKGCIIAFLSGIPLICNFKYFFKYDFSIFDYLDLNTAIKYQAHS
jgi:hypothetical protein